MNQYVTGAVIRQLREKARMTQAELAQRLFVSDKAVSKWESGKGCPDVSLWEPLAKALGVSIHELLAGRPVRNANTAGNMMRSVFYLCPKCGNVVHSTGEAVVSCHGAWLEPAPIAPADEEHMLFLEGVEDEYFLRVNHEMTRGHHITFLAAISQDRVQMVKLYPEQNPETRFQARGVRQIVFGCSRDGLFRQDVHRAIDGRRASYDDTPERRALEDAARRVLG